MAYFSLHRYLNTQIYIYIYFLRVVFVELSLISVYSLSSSSGSLLHTLLFYIFWLFVPKVFFFAMKVFLLLLFLVLLVPLFNISIYCFNSVFSIITALQFFLAPCKISLCRTIICLLTQWLFCILLNSFQRLQGENLFVPP